MEREIVELRRQVAQQNAAGTQVQPSDMMMQASVRGYAHDAAAGLLDLRSGYDKNINGRGSVFKRLENVSLTLDRIQNLFERFFTLYHPFLPFLDPDKPPDGYFQRSPLLFWTIITVGARNWTADEDLFSALISPLTRLVWSTISEVPQNYHIIKALILLCAWPLPTSSTSTDPTFILCGAMMQIAFQIGLHRPNHAQDFTKFKVDMRDTEIQDRVVVWSMCNICAQRVATAYGQPPSTMYDWTLGSKPLESNPKYDLPPAIMNLLFIEKFVDKVSRTLYSNAQDPLGLATDHERSTYLSFLSKDFEELEVKLRKDNSQITKIYIKAADLHMRLSAFFSPPDLPSYRSDMLKCYHATIAYLEACVNLDGPASMKLPSGYQHQSSLFHGTSYIFHMMLAAGFSLLRLMQNFLEQHELSANGATDLFNRTLWALRSMSVVENDLPERLTEVLAQVSKSRRLGATVNEGGRLTDIDDSLQLKVKCRMSVSLVYDSVWRWRKNFPVKGKLAESSIPQTTYLGQSSQNHLPSMPAAFDNTSTTNANTATNAGSNNSTGGTMTTDPSLSSSSMIPGMAGMSTGMIDNFGASSGAGGTTGMGFGTSNYEVFDPLTWMLDGLVDFPYTYGSVAGNMDQSGINAPDTMM